MFSFKQSRFSAQAVCLAVCVFCFIPAALPAAEADKPAVVPAIPGDPGPLTQQPQADPFAVPEGTPAELFAYIEGLSKAVPEKRDRDSVIEFITKLGKARNAACEKIFASAAATAEDKQKAAVILLSTTAQMAVRFGDQQAFKTMGELPAKFQAMNLPQIAAEAETAVMQVNLLGAMQGVPGAPPLDEAIKAMKPLVEKTPDMESFALVNMVVTALSQTGKTAEAAEMCQWAVKVFANSPEEKIKEQLPRFEGIARRMQLPGNTMTIKGTLMDGKPYDLATQKGKVVLVQFWATWCEPCIQEIFNVLKYYKLYHDLGFEVIGISIDEDKAQLDAFLKESKLPWPIMLDAKTPESNAARYGAYSVPVLILVDQQGKVVSLNARGPQLGIELEKLLGPPPAAKAAEQKPEAAVEKMEPIK